MPSSGRLRGAWQARVTVPQFTEDLTGRQAADAVRGRLDWKYCLGLSLEDEGFDFSVLSEFRARLVAGSLELAIRVPIRWGMPLQEVASRMKVLHERVAGTGVHKDMVKAGFGSPGDKPWTRKSGVLEYRTFYGVLQQMAAGGRG